MHYVLDLDYPEPGVAAINRVDDKLNRTHYCYMTIIVHMEHEKSNPKLLARAERIVATLNDAALAGKVL